jgi:hypothetical protein
MLFLYNNPIPSREFIFLNGVWPIHPELGFSHDFARSRLPDRRLTQAGAVAICGVSSISIASSALLVRNDDSTVHDFTYTHAHTHMRWCNALRHA